MKQKNILFSNKKKPQRNGAQAFAKGPKYLKSQSQFKSQPHQPPPFAEKLSFVAVISCLLFVGVR